MKKEEFETLKGLWTDENKEIMPVCFDKGCDEHICNVCQMCFCSFSKAVLKEGVRYVTKPLHNPLKVKK